MVTVHDIARKASINRATFYAHYTDKYELLDEVTSLAFENMIPEQIVQAQDLTEGRMPPVHRIDLQLHHYILSDMRVRYQVVRCAYRW